VARSGTTWQRGQSGNPKGRPRREIERGYVDATIGGCPVKAWSEIVARAVADAKGGDGKARDWLTRLLLGSDAPTAPAASEPASPVFPPLQVSVSAEHQRWLVEFERDAAEHFGATSTDPDLLGSYHASRNGPGGGNGSAHAPAGTPGDQG